MEDLWTYISVLAPSIGVGLIFWLAMRAIFRADRGERAAEAEVREASQDEDSAPSSDDSAR